MVIATDDDTAAVVFIAGIIIIAVLVGYGTYIYVRDNAEGSRLFGFQRISTTLFTKTPHLTHVTMPLLDMGEGQLTLFSGENIHSLYGL
jgi:hypothetical protein